MFDRKSYMHQYNKEYRESHKDILNERSSKYYYENRKNILNEQRSKRDIKRTRERELYRINNKKLSNSAYYQRRKKAGKVDIDLFQDIYETNIKEYGTLTCSYCHIKIEFGKDSIDHMQPVSRDGKSTRDNLCISCISCNCSKGDKTVAEYKEFISH